MNDSLMLYLTALGVSHPELELRARAYLTETVTGAELFDSVEVLWLKLGAQLGYPVMRVNAIQWRHADEVAEVNCPTVPEDPPVDPPPPIVYPPEQTAPYLITAWPTPPARNSATTPMSHQGDARFTPTMVEEFAAFDDGAWYSLPSVPYVQGEMLGRKPARYAKNNVAIEDGELTIRMRQVNPLQTDPNADDFDPASTMDQPTPYGGYTSGCVISKQYHLYGYFECRAKIMPSAGSSAFWLAFPVHTDPQTEIDVFEMGGKGVTPNPNGDGTFLSSNNRYNMNYHLFESEASPGQEGYNRDVCWTAPFDFADDYHVYGLDWQADYIRWYVDGVLIHVKENFDHHSPMKVVLDSEAFWGGEPDGGWFGFPNNADLPSKFRVDYVRVWHKATE